MTDSEFEQLGKNILRWKYQYYKLGKPELSDEAYDYKEWQYCKEATNRNIQENEVGKMEDGKFFTFTGYNLNYKP
jgi:NAD-dependent DNA ligase